MENQIFTLGMWRVRPGEEEAFITAWRELGGFFMSLAQPPGPGTLVQSLDEPQLFYSFGPWPSLDAVQSMRADPRTPAMIGKLTALCSEAKPGTFGVVATIP